MFLTWSLLLAVLAPGPAEEIDTWVPLVGERGTVTLSELELLEGEEPQVGDVRIAVSADTPYWAGAMVQGEWLEELVKGADRGDGLVVRMRTTGAPGSVRVWSMGRIEASRDPGGGRAVSLTGSAMVELDATVLGDQWRRVFLPCRPEHDVPRGLGSGLPARIADAELYETQTFVPILVLATPGVVLELADWELDPTGIFDAQGYVEPAAWATPSTVDADPLIREWSELPTRIALGEAGASDLARIREAVDRADDAGLAIRRALREKWAARILEDGGDPAALGVRLGRLEDATGQPTPLMAFRGGARQPDWLGRAVWHQGRSAVALPGIEGEERVGDRLATAWQNAERNATRAVSWERFLERKYGDERVLALAWSPAAGMRHGLTADETFSSTIASPTPPLATDVRLADYVEWAGEWWGSLADEMTSEVSRLRPDGIAVVWPFGPPLAGSAGEWEWALASVETEASLPTAIWRAPSLLLARFCLSGTGSGARQSGYPIYDHGLVGSAYGLPSPSDWNELGHALATRRRATVAVIASRRELALGRSLAPGLLATLDDLGVDADILSDAALLDAPDIQSRYKALIYETGSLDPEPFRAAWGSGLPTFFIGPIDEDDKGRRGRQGAQAILAGSDAFIIRPGPTQTQAIPPLASSFAMDPIPVHDPLGSIARTRWSDEEEATEVPPLAGLHRMGWSWTFAQAAPISAGDWAWQLEIAPAPPAGTRVYLNGREVGEVKLGVAASGVWRCSVPSAAISSVRRNELALRLAWLPPPPRSSAALRPYPKTDLAVTTELHHLKVGDVLSTPAAGATLAPRSEALAPGVAVLGTYGDDARPGLLRQGNRLLWAGPATVAQGDPGVQKALASFLAMLGEPNTYPPHHRHTMLAVAEGGGGALIVPRTDRATEIDLGTNRVFRIGVPTHGADWQRVHSNGRSVVAIPGRRAGDALWFVPTELELRPSGDHMVVREMLRDSRDPERLILIADIEGAGRGVVHSPFDGLWNTTALIDDAAVHVGGSGSTAEFDIPPGRHEIRVEIHCPGADPVESRLYARFGAM